MNCGELLFFLFFVIEVALCRIPYQALFGIVFDELFIFMTILMMLHNHNLLHLIMICIAMTAMTRVMVKVTMTSQYVLCLSIVLSFQLLRTRSLTPSPGPLPISPRCRTIRCSFHFYVLDASGCYFFCFFIERTMRW